jgi:phosphohistidine phosphatase
VARTLLLVRHAKAVAHAATDEVRPLAARGVHDAQAAGRWLVEQQLIPDHGVVSPALRAVQTWEQIRSALGAEPSVETDDRIYDNSVESLFAVVQDVADDAAILAIVGHNPSIQAFALALDDGSGAPHARADLTDAYPTTGIAVLTVDVNWADLTPGGATLRAFATPRA